MNLNNYSKEELIAYIRTIETEPELVVQEKLQQYSNVRYREGYDVGFKAGYERSAQSRVSDIVKNIQNLLTDYIVESIQSQIDYKFGKQGVVPPRLNKNNFTLTSEVNPMDFTTTVVVHLKGYTARVRVDDMV